MISIPLPTLSKRITNFVIPRHAFLFSLLKTRATDWTEKERQLVLWRTAYVEDLMGVLPFAYLIIFSLSRFSLFFSEDDTIF